MGVGVNVKICIAEGVNDEGKVENGYLRRFIYDIIFRKFFTQIKIKQ